MKISQVVQFVATAATSYAVLVCVGSLWDTMSGTWEHSKVDRDRRQRLRLALEHQTYIEETENQDSGTSTEITDESGTSED